jgi:hypothetical protein
VRDVGLHFGSGFEVGRLLIGGYLIVLAGVEGGLLQVRYACRRSDGLGVRGDVAMRLDGNDAGDAEGRGAGEIQLGTEWM